MAKNSMKPQIRFKGFTDAWEQRKLGDVFLYERPNKYIVASDKYSDFYSTPVLTANKGFVLGYTNEKRTYNTPCVIFDDFTLDSKYVDFPFMVKSSALKILTTKQGYYLPFAYELLHAANIEVLGHARHYISVVQPTMVLVPSYSEQLRVGKFIEAIDNLITLHQRKYEKFVNIKKALLEKMFPQGDEKVPRIRFKGFTDAWEQRKLGEVAQSFEYGLNVAAKEYDGINKYLRITDIDDVSRKFDTDNLTSPDTELAAVENYRLVDGDILFARTGASVGKSYIYRVSDGLVYFAGFLIRAKIKPEYDAEFVFQNTLSESYEKYVQITSQRSGQPGVNAQEYSDYVFYLPTYDEQQKIGAFLRNLDNLITLHQRQVEKLKNIKSALLEKMFV